MPVFSGKDFILLALGIRIELIFQPFLESILLQLQGIIYIVSAS